METAWRIVYDCRRNLHLSKFGVKAIFCSVRKCKNRRPVLTERLSSSGVKRFVLRRLRVAPVRPRPRFAEPQLQSRSLRKLDSTTRQGITQLGALLRMFRSFSTNVVSGCNRLIVAPPVFLGAITQRSYEALTRESSCSVTVQPTRLISPWPNIVKPSTPQRTYLYSPVKVLNSR